MSGENFIGLILIFSAFAFAIYLLRVGIKFLNLGANFLASVAGISNLEVFANLVVFVFAFSVMGLYALAIFLVPYIVIYYKIRKGIIEKINYKRHCKEMEIKLKEERRELVKFEIAKEMILDLVSLHIETLARKRKQLRIIDDYGNVDDSSWRKEIFYFFKKSSLAGKIFLNDEQIYEIIDQKVVEHAGLESRPYEEELDPIKYESYCADLLRQNGWDARTTQATGDQGVDVIATKKGRICAVQCKKYSTAVGNKAVQEVYAGMQYIGAHFCAVVTNAGYTRSAKQLAQTLGVLLLHHDDLKFLDENGRLNF